MRCPYCDKIISDKAKCSCGKDVSVLIKSIKLSNSYYNRGLDKAKVHDLSGAICDLKKSLKFNKNNTDARNLLGLTYYEMGEVVNALSEWVLSKHFQPEDNKMAEEYLDDIQASPTKIDNFNQAIKKYNLALQAAKQDNDDLAIIHLKKVITLNTHYLKAMQLLALEYIKIDEPDKAKKLLKRARKLDVSNIVTLSYLSEVTASEENKEAIQNGGIEEKVFNFPIGAISYREEKPNKMLYLNLIIGLVLGICVTAFLIVPHVKRKAISEYNTASIGKSDAMSANSVELDNVKSENDGLNTKIEELNKEIANMQTQMGGIECYNNLLTASKLFIAGDKENSAITLSSVDTTLFASEDALVLYNYIKEQVYGEVVTKLANEGKNLCNAGKMEEALVPLLKAYQMTSEDDAVLYFLGRSYQKLSDNETAKKYYDELLEKFPTTTRAATARKRLREMGYDVKDIVVPVSTTAPVDGGNGTTDGAGTGDGTAGTTDGAGTGDGTTGTTDGVGTGDGTAGTTDGVGIGDGTTGITDGTVTGETPVQ